MAARRVHLSRRTRSARPLQRRPGTAERVARRVGEGAQRLVGEREVIIYTQHDPATKLDLWHLPLSGGAARPLLNTPFNEAQARISPDGRWIAYVSDRSGHAGGVMRSDTRSWTHHAGYRAAAVPSRNGEETSGSCSFSHRIDR